MPLRAKQSERFRDREEEILDKLFHERNTEIRAACKLISKGAKHGLAIYDSLAIRDASARKANDPRVPHRDFLLLQGLLWLMEFELATLLDDYLRSRGERRWLYARLLFLTLYESTKTLRSAFSKGLRQDMLATLPGSEKQLNKMHSYIQTTFEDLNATYGDVRRKLVAHRDPDASIRSRLLGTLSPIDIKDLSWNVLCWSASLALIQKQYLAVIALRQPPAGSDDELP
jgi:hypothetical protein